MSALGWAGSGSAAAGRQVGIGERPACFPALLPPSPGKGLCSSREDKVPSRGPGALRCLSRPSETARAAFRRQDTGSSNTWPPRGGGSGWAVCAERAAGRRLPVAPGHGDRSWRASVRWAVPRNCVPGGAQAPTSGGSRDCSCPTGPRDRGAGGPARRQPAFSGLRAHGQRAPSGGPGPGPGPGPRTAPFSGNPFATPSWGERQNSGGGRRKAHGCKLKPLEG